MGVRTSFPRWHSAPHFLGCQLPDVMGHASGVIGLVAGLRSVPFTGSDELLSEAFSRSLRSMVAPRVYKLDQKENDYE